MDYYTLTGKIVLLNIFLGVTKTKSGVTISLLQTSQVQERTKVQHAHDHMPLAISKNLNLLIANLADFKQATLGADIFFLEFIRPVHHSSPTRSCYAIVV